MKCIELKEKVNINFQKASNSKERIFFKGPIISKANCQALNASKKRMNEFVFTTKYAIRLFFEEIENTKKKFRNYLTFTLCSYIQKGHIFEGA